MDLGLRDRVAIVTGASAGIGLAAARALAEEGCRLVIGSRSPERIGAAAAAIAGATGARVLGVAVDVTDRGAGERIVGAAVEAFGPPGILVTNGGGPEGGGAAKSSLEEFEAAIRLSFLSVVGLTQAALPHMKRAGWGRLIHVSSGVVPEPNPDLFLSSSVRPAVAGFSKALAGEVAALGITSNLVCPGFIRTEALRELAARRAREAGTSIEEALGAMESGVPMARLGEPEELAAAICFLASERAAYITGVALRVDGGKVSFLL